MTSYFQDGDHGVISRIKVLPSGECTRSVRPESANNLSTSTVHSRFEIINAQL